jgi:hypothetical protein
MFTGELEPDIYFNEDEIYVHYDQFENLKFLSHNDQTIIIDETGKKIAELEASSRAQLIGTTLYEIREKSYIETKIDDLFTSYDYMSGHQIE